VNTIRVRHDLGPAQKALLAALSWDYVVDPDAEPCVSIALPRGGVTVPGKPGKPCPRCAALLAGHQVIW
jgi:hypothetical protein